MPDWSQHAQSDGRRPSLQHAITGHGGRECVPVSSAVATPGGNEALASGCSMYMSLQLAKPQRRVHTAHLHAITLSSDCHSRTPSACAVDGVQQHHAASDIADSPAELQYVTKQFFSPATCSSIQTTSAIWETRITRVPRPAARSSCRRVPVIAGQCQLVFRILREPRHAEP